MFVGLNFDPTNQLEADTGTPSLESSEVSAEKVKFACMLYPAYITVKNNMIMIFTRL